MWVQGVGWEGGRDIRNQALQGRIHQGVLPELFLPVAQAMLACENFSSSKPVVVPAEKARTLPGPCRDGLTANSQTEPGPGALRAGSRQRLPHFLLDGIVWW